MPLQPAFDHLDLVQDARLVRPGAGADPFRDRPAETGRGKGRRDSGIADPHLAQDQDIRALIDRRRPLPERIEAVRLAHRRAFGEIAGRAAQLQRDHRQIGAVGAAKLVDRRPPGLKIRDHLGGHFLRIGVHALRADAVVPGKDQRLRAPDLRSRGAAPGGHEFRDLFQTAQRPRRLGQRVLTRPRGLGRVAVGLGQAVGQRRQGIQRVEGRQAHLISLSWAGRRRQGRPHPPLPRPAD